MVRSPRGRLRLLAFAVLLAIAAAACGDDGDRPEVSGERLSHDEFLSQFDERCDQLFNDATHIRIIRDPENMDQQHDHFVELKRITVEARHDFEAISPPEELEDAWADAIESMEDSEAVLDDLAAAAAESDTDAMADLIEDYNATVEGLRQAAVDMDSQCLVRDDLQPSTTTTLPPGTVVTPETAPS